MLLLLKHMFHQRSVHLNMHIRFLLPFLLVAIAAQGQKNGFGILGGINYSTRYTSYLTEVENHHAIGFHVGILNEFTINDRTAITFNPSFEMLRQKFTISFTPSSPRVYIIYPSLTPMHRTISRTYPHITLPVHLQRKWWVDEAQYVVLSAGLFSAVSTMDFRISNDEVFYAQLGAGVSGGLGYDHIRLVASVDHPFLHTATSKPKPWLGGQSIIAKLSIIYML